MRHTYVTGRRSAHMARRAVRNRVRIIGDLSASHAEWSDAFGGVQRLDRFLYETLQSN
ncbi:protein of unknown function [Pararobbsia alpina]